MSNKIKSISAREILSSGGAPTVEAIVGLDNGIVAKASVPFGVSAGTHEAFILLDKDPKRYNGKGQLKACKNIETSIAKALKANVASTPRKID